MMLLADVPDEPDFKNSGFIFAHSDSATTCTISFWLRCHLFEAEGSNLLEAIA